MKRMVSTSVVRVPTLLSSRRTPSLDQVTTGRGLPCILNDVTVDAAGSDLLWRTPLESTGSVGHIVHRETSGLAGGG
ncbi:hypothetical protein EYF80_006304 [Liparis tanakae]|uniref:Uncharacterized protein n=1 Tax=Liparis tanakae TaxID=230148 RepID=A0A4Z2J1K9_9TELE|nr:hypothetical protein EYF80_006304 [Liparis tanakae]